MNGFSNAILSVLLGWLRALLNSVWQLLGSEGSGSFFQFLRDHWTTVALVLIVGGFIVDRVVYFLRWRPDYLWRSRKRHASEPAAYEEQDVPYEDNPPPFDASTRAYQPIVNEQYAPPAPPYEYAAYQPPAAPAPQYEEPMQVETPYPHDSLPADGPVTTFAPPATYAKTFSAPLANDPLSDDTRFDEDLSAWSEPTRVGESYFAPQITPLAQNPAQGMTPTFGAAQPEPTAYLQDVQAGFAPPPSPEQLYRRHPIVEEPAVATQVHPGLDPQVLQQNIGLTVNEQYDDQPRTDAYAGFVPFTEAQPEAQPTRTGNAFSSFAKKARSLVGGMDDEVNPLSIRDLQSNVDVKSAFHAPVYPKRKPEREDE